MGDGESEIQIEKWSTFLWSDFLSDLKLRFFVDGRMWASVTIGQLNMKGKRILFAFLFCF